MHGGVVEAMSIFTSTARPVAKDPCSIDSESESATLSLQCSIHGHGIDANHPSNGLILVKTLPRLALALAFLPFAAFAQKADFAKPIESQMLPDSILCKSPEGIYLLYEGSYLAMKSLGEQVFDTFFMNSFREMKAAGECVYEKKGQQVLVTGMVSMVNPLKAPKVVGTYGKVKLKQYPYELYTISSVLPGLEVVMQRAIDLHLQEKEKGSK